MHPRLDEFVRQFRHAQDVAVRILIHELSIPRPASNLDWTCYLSRIPEIKPPDGLRLRPHGYGVEVTTNNLTVDFDWGDHGEGDGFDAWRLLSFQLDNHRKPDASHDEVKSWLAEASEAGELITDTLLYYDPNRRESHKGRM